MKQIQYDALKQRHMPYVEALEEYVQQKYVPFHTPGHKGGVGAPTTLKAWMNGALPYDLGVMYALDDLHEPEGPLKEAQELAAALYGAEETWFSVNGTTALIEAIIMATTQAGDTILLPRDSHKSVSNGLVLSGAKPAYIEGTFNHQWGISEGITVETLQQAIRNNPAANVVLLVHPNYYGVALPLKELVEVAHQEGLLVLVDEAHGAHLPFSERLPLSAIEAGADLVAQSTHKLGASLTQTSMLHGQGCRYDRRRVVQAHQMLQSTSPNNIFLASLDMARYEMATEGHMLMERTVHLAIEAREAINAIAGIEVMPYISNRGGTIHDCTKLLISFAALGLGGIEAEKLLRLARIEVELIVGDSVLVLITVGDTEGSVRALVDALTDISYQCLGRNKTCSGSMVSPPRDKESSLPVGKVVLTPREAFFATKKLVDFPSEAIGKIAGETITYYPPGIPCLIMGEEITPETIAYIQHKQQMGYKPNGARDVNLHSILICT